MKKEKKLLSFLIAALTAFSIFAPSAAVSAISMDTEILSPYSSNVKSGNILVGVKGSYFADIDAALERINEIRLEACKEGIRNPDDPAHNLTMDDYVPIKWSSELEKVARVRAAEAIISIGHTRPNGQDCWSVNSPEITDTGEVLAWNFSKSLVSGINQFYEEKNDWINNTGRTTGHYTSMISPNNTYVGLGGFYSDCGSFASATCGRFGRSVGYADGTKGSPTGTVIVPVEIPAKSISSPFIKKISGSGSMNIGETAEYELRVNTTINGDYGYVLIYDNVAWSSSDNSVAVADSFGNVSAVNFGKAVITAKSGQYSASFNLTVECNHVFKTQVVAPTSSSEGYTLHTCTVCGYNYKDNYTAKVENTKLTSNNVKISYTSCTFDGKKHYPKVTVSAGGKKLKKDVDYKVSYSNNLNAGTATVTVKGTGKYQGTVKKKFRINKVQISDGAIYVSSAKIKYTGKQIKPAVTVILDGKVLKKGKDFTVKYSNNVKKGKAYITVTGKGNYSGEKKAMFYIV